MFTNLLNMKHLSGAPLLGRLPGLPINIRLGWKGLQGNTLAYYELKKFKIVNLEINLRRA
jgi:hypothetical protein